MLKLTLSCALSCICLVKSDHQLPVSICFLFCLLFGIICRHKDFVLNFLLFILYLKKILYQFVANSSEILYLFLLLGVIANLFIIFEYSVIVYVCLLYYFCLILFSDELGIQVELAVHVMIHHQSPMKRLVMSFLCNLSVVLPHQQFKLILLLHHHHSGY